MNATETREQSTNKPVNPQVGMIFTHPTLGNVRVEKVWPYGTVEVKNVWTERYYRISGLAIGGGK